MLMSGLASRLVAGVVALAGFESQVSAGDLRVPADFATIQAAIDAAQGGDRVLVSPGTYFENLDFKGKAITVTSTDGACVTTVDGLSKDSVVKFKSGEGASSVLSGFTIENGQAVNGGGIYCLDSSPTLVGNVVIGNT